MNRKNQNLAHQIKEEGLWAPWPTRLKMKNPILGLGKLRSRKYLNNRTKSAARTPHRRDKAKHRGQARDYRTRATHAPEKCKSIKPLKEGIHQYETFSRRRDGPLLLSKTLLTIKVRQTTFCKRVMLRAGRIDPEASGLTRMPSYLTSVHRMSTK